MSDENTEIINWKHVNKTLNDWFAESQFDIEQSEKLIAEHQSRIKGIATNCCSLLTNLTNKDEAKQRYEGYFRSKSQ